MKRLWWIILLIFVGVAPFFLPSLKHKQSHSIPNIDTADFLPSLNQIDTTQLINLVNKDRSDAGETALTTDEGLTSSAQDKCNDMVKNQYFAHVSPTGVDWSAGIKKYYPYYQYAGENLDAEWSPTSTDTVNTLFMNSPEHKANILNASFTKIGVATCIGKYQDKITLFTVEHFLQPLIPTAVVPVETPSTKTCLQPNVPTGNRYDCSQPSTYPPCINGENPYDGSLYCF